MKIPKSIFSKPRSKWLASRIHINTPEAFKKSVRTLSRGGLSLREFRALKLAQTRAKIMLRRGNLSMKERNEFGQISKLELPMFRRK